MRKCESNIAWTGMANQTKMPWSVSRRNRREEWIFTEICQFCWIKTYLGLAVTSVKHVCTCQFIPYCASAIHAHMHTCIFKPFEDSEPTGLKVDIAETLSSLSWRPHTVSITASFWWSVWKWSSSFWPLKYQLPWSILLTWKFEFKFNSSL